MLEPDWAALKARRDRLDAAIEAFWVGAMPPDYPLRTMRYSNTRAWLGPADVAGAMTHSSTTRNPPSGRVTTLLAQTERGR